MIEYYHHKLEEHYTRSLDEISLTGKAPKDVVGKSYEQFREEIITQFPDLDVATAEERKVFYSFFNLCVKLAKKSPRNSFFLNLVNV